MTNSAAPNLRQMEEIVILAPLGIRFWDVASDSRVDEDLIVRARPAASPREISTAQANRSGIYTFRNLSRLHDVEYPATRVLGTGAPLPSRPYIVDVQDQLGRFVPVAFRVDLPFLGVFPAGPLGGAPADSTPGFFLFSAATRTPPAKLAVARITLLLEATGEPAANAIVELTLPDGSLVNAIADADGQVTAMFPYPAFAASLATPMTPEQARAPATWSLSLRVLFEAARQTPLLPDLPPDIAELLQQAPVNIWPTVAGPSVNQLDVTLVFGRETILRTENQPHLLVG